MSNVLGMLGIVVCILAWVYAVTYALALIL
jgi:hypothetical protein